MANLEELGAVAASENDQLARIIAALPDATVYRVPFMARDVYDLDGLAEVADHLAEPRRWQACPPPRGGLLKASSWPLRPSRS